MKSLALLALLMPFASATIAGSVVWLTNRGRLVNDGSLLRQFLLILSICMMFAWGVSRTTTFRLRTDPQFALLTALKVHPLYLTIKQYEPDKESQLLAQLGSHLAKGATLDSAFRQTRPLLSHMLRPRVAFASDTAVLVWAQVHLDTLRELGAKNPALCVQYLLAQAADQSPDQQTLTLALSELSADNHSAFQAALIELYASADSSMRRQTSTDPSVELRDVQLAYRTITEQVQQHYGLTLGDSTGQVTAAQLQVDSPMRVCSAYMYRFEAMQAQYRPVAARLLRGVLRE